jgi:YVTN family beta-propeller protein
MQPHGSALSPDGRYLYVSNNHRQMSMTMSSARGDTEQGDAQGDPSMDHDEMDHDEMQEDAMQEDATSGSVPSGNNGTISVIDTESFEVVDVIEVGEYPTGIGTRARW